jgi:hypothetical protein
MTQSPVRPAGPLTSNSECWMPGSSAPSSRGREMASGAGRGRRSLVCPAPPPLSLPAATRDAPDQQRAGAPAGPVDDKQPVWNLRDCVRRATDPDLHRTSNKRRKNPM